MLYFILCTLFYKCTDKTENNEDNYNTFYGPILRYVTYNDNQ